MPQEYSSIKLAVGVITFNNSPEELAFFASNLSAALKAVEHSSLPKIEFQLISISNGDVSRWPALEIDHLEMQSRGNIGFAAAANAILQHASELNFNSVLLANPDGALHYNCLNEIIKAHNEHPCDLLEARQFPEEHPKYYDPETGQTSWISGACALIPLASYRRIGEIDEQFFLYMEDIDYSWRARAIGINVRVVRKALFFHKVLGRHPSRATSNHSASSIVRFVHKWHGPKDLQRLGLEEVTRCGGGEIILAAPSALTPVEHSVRDFSQPYFGEGRW